MNSIFPIPFSSPYTNLYLAITYHVIIGFVHHYLSNRTNDNPCSHSLPHLTPPFTARPYCHSSRTLYGWGHWSGHSFLTSSHHWSVHSLEVRTGVRLPTLHRLRLLRTLGLGTAIEVLLSDDPWWPLVTRDHLNALDVRLHMVLEAVERCRETEGGWAAILY